MEKIAAKLECPKRENAAGITIERLAKLADRIEGITNKLDTKLTPVMCRLNPTPESVEGEDREYPPLFAEINGRINQINNCADALESFLKRTEL